jgi:hypothetical protein
MNRSSANRRTTHEHGVRPLEVDVPLVRARMKESNKFTRVWIGSRDVWTFVPVAVKTRESEVLDIGHASMLACNDVIDVKGQRVHRNG